jgi:hypothetical protein
MDSFVQKLIEALTAAFGKLAEGMLQSWTGKGLLALAVGLIVFPMGKRLWNLSRYAFAGVVVLLVAAYIHRPEMPELPKLPVVVKTDPPKQTQAQAETTPLSFLQSVFQGNSDSDSIEFPCFNCDRTLRHRLADRDKASLCTDCGEFNGRIGDRAAHRPPPAAGSHKVACIRCNVETIILSNGISETYRCDNCGRKHDIWGSKEWYASRIYLKSQSAKPSSLTSTSADKAVPTTPRGISSPDVGDRAPKSMQILDFDVRDLR